MATLAADSSTISEARRAPSELTNFSGLLMVGGGVLLLVAFGLAKSFSGDNSLLMSRFWHAYLLGATFAASISIGGLFFVIAHHLTGGRWATSLRRLAEIVAGSIFFSAVLFIPIIINVYSGSNSLYSWNNADTVAKDAVLLSKASWLDANWFVVRNIGYFVLWIMLASFFIRGSVKQDETGQVAPLRRLSRWSGLAMVALALSLNFAAFDWLMSLAPHWFSTIFGVYFFAGSLIAFLAVLLLMTVVLQSRGVLTRSVTVDNRHDIAKLMYAMIVFWGYITFSQFMLIWYANVPEETEWYVDRQNGVSAFGIPPSLAWLFVLHLFIPFLGFMSRTVRRNKMAMTGWAIYMLLVHAYDLALVIMPGALHTSEGLVVANSPLGMFGMLELMCLAGASAVLLGAILMGAQDRWLLPVRDPRLKQSMTYHNV